MHRIAELFLFLSSAFVQSVFAIQGTGWRAHNGTDWLLPPWWKSDRTWSTLLPPQPPSAGSIGDNDLCILSFLPPCPWILLCSRLPLLCGYPSLAEASKTAPFVHNVVDESCPLNVLKDRTPLVPLLLFCSPATAQVLRNFNHFHCLLVFCSLNTEFSPSIPGPGGYLGYLDAVACSTFLHWHFYSPSTTMDH